MDDVLYTGRTIRAALDALFDHGRPARVQLLVLIDRGHRELPIEARFIGRTVQTTDIEIIEVKFQEIDGMEKVLLVERRSGAKRRVSAYMPAGLLGIEELDRAEIEAILARAKDFQPLQSQSFEEARHAARQDDRQSLLRSLHAHPHQLRNRRQAPGRRRGFDHRVGLERFQGRIAGGHAEHAGAPCGPTRS